MNHVREEYGGTKRELVDLLWSAVTVKARASGVIQKFGIYVSSHCVRGKAQRRRVFVDTRRNCNAAMGGRGQNISGELLNHTTSPNYS
ncbi:MAG: hypothetical protein ACI8TQ_002204, partial [Planctomycetota bacterium]